MVETWLPAAAVVPQERGPEWFEPVDGMPWSDGDGYHRGFRSSFRLRAGKTAWFHFAFPTPAGSQLDQVALLWEVEDGALLGQLIVQHGGMDRHALMPPGTRLAGEAVPFHPPEDLRHHYPASSRLLTTLAVEPPIATRFGMQLCIHGSAPEEAGTIRFYGAGARFS